MSGASQTFALDVGGRQLLIGGDWRLAANAAEVKAVKSELVGGTILFELQHAEDRSVVLYSRPSKAALKADAASGGAIVALLSPNVFVCHQIDAVSYWVFAAVDGHPLPGFDRVVREVDVGQMLADARMSRKRLTVVGTHSDAEVALEDLLQGADAISWMTAAIKARKSWVRPVMGAGACVALLGGYALYLHFSGPAPQADTHAAAPARQVTATPVAAPASAPVQTSVIEHPDRVSAASAVQVAFQAIRGLPPSVNGWVVSSAKCNVSEGKCIVTWVASPGAMPDGAKSIPKVDLTLDGVLGKQVTSALDVEFASSGPATPVESPNLLSLYSLDTNFQSTPNVYSVTVGKPERPAVGAGHELARVTAFGPMWAWEKIATAIQKPAIGVEAVTLSQLATNDPQLRVAAVAYLATGAAAAVLGLPDAHPDSPQVADQPPPAR